MTIQVGPMADADSCVEPATRELQEIVANFEPVELDALEEATLVDRMDDKYLLQAASLPELLASLLQQYQVLEVGGKRIHGYDTVYFDTPDLAFYHRHHSGKVHRYKIRARHYATSGETYLEVKRKVKLNRTRKERLRAAELSNEIPEEAAAFLAGYAANEDLRPVLQSRFQRITLVGRDRPERVTLDVGLRFSSQAHSAALADVAIGEVKLQDRSTPSPFKEAMRRAHVQSAGFSKYCIGLVLLYPDLKHNRFKEQLLHMRKLMKGPLHV